MHTVARLFAILCGLVVIVIAVRYGYRASDNDIDGTIWGFVYGVIAMGGLFGPALSLRAWRYSRSMGAIATLVTLSALVIGISNELGALSGRSNSQQAERSRVADAVSDARRSLKRAEDERQGVKFVPADHGAVEAAKARANAATSAKEAECTVRGPKCRAIEVVEAQALANLADVAARKASGDRAAALDAQIKELRGKIEQAGPVLETNSQGKALARLFGRPEAEAATLTTWQNLVMMTVVELLIVVTLMAAEVIEIGERQSKPAAPMPSAKRVPEIEHREPDEIEAEAIEATKPVPVPVPSRPRLVVSNPIGNVPQVMADILAPGRGKIEIAELHTAYLEACESQSLRPISAKEFPAAVAVLCETLKIDIKAVGTGVYLLRTKLKTAEATGRALQTPRA